MFYNLLYPLSSYINWFNLFQYTTVRAGFALFTAFFIALIIGPKVISKMTEWTSKKDTVREFSNGGESTFVHSVESALAKKGTPTMGGVMIIISTFIATILWADVQNPYIWLVLAVGLVFSSIGLIDDYLSINKLWKNGIPGKVRLGAELLFSGLIAALIYKALPDTIAGSIYFPFVKTWIITLPIWAFVIWVALVITGMANSVNVTDGLDGLVAIPAVFLAGAFAILAFICNSLELTGFLSIAYIPGSKELMVLCSALVGGVLGFLWYNAPPAKIFMGDTGSLAIGAMVATVALIIKQEFTMAVIGIIFVLETLSVFTQIISLKLTGKRIFKMAPVHHHFEKLGWAETTIVVRFWIVSLLAAVIGLAMLKIR